MHNVHLFNDSNFSQFIELEKCYIAEQYWKCSRAKVLYNFNTVEVHISQQVSIIWTTMHEVKVINQIRSFSEKNW